MTLKQDSFILLGANMRLRMDTVATPWTSKFYPTRIFYCIVAQFEALFFKKVGKRFVFKNRSVLRKWLRVIRRGRPPNPTHTKHPKSNS
jgi:hypothetical protein